jgi:non-ribosomal peptide synthetase component F
MNISKLLFREIENQIEDKVVPVISSIMGSVDKVDNRLESYEDGESTPHFQDNRNSTNERNPDLRNHDLRIPFVQNENGFI